jgi:AcrR family transcriptional regulator
MSRVARTTLYRHFDGPTDLLAAAFERLLPPAQVADTTVPVRESLAQLLRGQAALIEQAPLQLTTLAWLALVPEGPGAETNALAPLRARVIEHYREPFDRVLSSEVARIELDEIEPEFAIVQLVGPLVFARLTGLRSMSAADCDRLVDDFLNAYRRC